ncbi:NUDIX domain-containing protein [Mesorhizobium sp. CAU 1741]|uniref:NUDIX hydrolase n=1 Tax=Mesorhizobium sp. CAU 1741 TaxID=3140366 RepID=UPI00325B7E74
MSNRVRYQLSASVFVALRNSDQVLMLRRKGTGWMDGSFSLPAGGLDAGETISQAAIREAYEEIGIGLSPGDLVYAHTLHSLTEGQNWMGHFFIATRWEGTPKLVELDKHSDIGWWPMGSLPSRTIPYVRQALLNIGKAIPYSEYGWGEAER